MFNFTIVNTGVTPIKHLLTWVMKIVHIQGKLLNVEFVFHSIPEGTMSCKTDLSVKFYDDSINYFDFKPNGHTVPE